MDNNPRVIKVPNLFKNICLSDDNMVVIETY